MEKAKKFYIEMYMMLNELEMKSYKDYYDPASVHFKSEWMQGFLGCIDLVQIKMEKMFESYEERERDGEA